MTFIVFLFVLFAFLFVLSICISAARADRHMQQQIKRAIKQGKITGIDLDESQKIFQKKQGE